MLEARQSRPVEFDPLLGSGQFVGGNSGNQEVLPDRQADIAVAEVVGNSSEFVHLFDEQFADGKHDADVKKTVLLLRMHANMGLAILGRPRRHEGRMRPAIELAAELWLPRRGEEFRKAPGVEHVFQPRLVRGWCGRRCSIKTRTMASATLRGLLRLDDARRYRARKS